MAVRVAGALPAALLLFLLLPGCVAPAPTEVRTDARAVRSVTWSVREEGRWPAEEVAPFAEDLGFSTERVDDVLLLFDDAGTMLRFSPREGGLIVTLTSSQPRAIPVGVPAAHVARELRDAYAPEADATLALFEERFGWERQGDGAWSHATYRPRLNASRSAATPPP